MVRPNTNWVRIHDGSRRGRKPMEMECQRCGATLLPSLPISMDLLAALGNAFGRKHARCRKRDRPA